jgi:glycosyltransferase involved in cell wall biosynthesis
MVNNFHYPRGGSERCYLDLSALLVERGHEVIPFSSQNVNNLETTYSNYFVSQIDFDELIADRRISLQEKLGNAARVLFSKESKEKIEQLLAIENPDLVHIHGIAHHISPSILPSIRSKNIPIVMTLHDYKLICPNTNFLSNDQVCERCKIYRYYNVILRKCKRNSLSASLLASIEMYFHKMIKIYERNVDAFITPSEFLGHKLREFKVGNRIEHIPNFVDIDAFGPVYDHDNYCLYFGRLDKEKGVITLLEAMKHTESFPLLIAGDGPERSFLRDFARENELSNVTFLGKLAREELIPLIQRSAFTLIPSIWYENYPMSIIESFASGTPVIGSDIGAIPGLIKPQWNGLLFDPRDANDLAQKMQFLRNSTEASRRMGQNGRKQVERYNHPEYHYHKTVALYQSLC